MHALIVLAFASYGVQHTHVSGVPLWREREAIGMTLDAAIPGDARAAIAAGFAAWPPAVASCGLSFAVGTGPAAAATVHVRRDRWCDDSGTCFDPSIASITVLDYIDDPTDPDDGKVLDAHVELNDVDFDLLGTGPGMPALDLQSVATHEAGHVLGLDHDCSTSAAILDLDGNPVPPCAGADAAVVAATMYFQVEPGDTGARTLEAADVAGGCAIAERAHAPDIAGGCAASGAPGSPLAIMIVVVRRRRHCMRR